MCRLHRKGFNCTKGQKTSISLQQYHSYTICHKSTKLASEKATNWVDVRSYISRSDIGWWLLHIVFWEAHFSLHWPDKVMIKPTLCVCEWFFKNIPILLGVKNWKEACEHVPACNHDELFKTLKGCSISCLLEPIHNDSHIITLLVGNLRRIPVKNDLLEKSHCTDFNTNYETSVHTYNCGCVCVAQYVNYWTTTLFHLTYSAQTGHRGCAVERMMKRWA